MMDARTLSAIFRGGDLEFRPGRVARYWVVRTVMDDPVRCVRVYGRLLREGGTSHAADLFLSMLEEARKSRPWVFWMRSVVMDRPEPVLLPG